MRANPNTRTLTLIEFLPVSPDIKFMWGKCCESHESHRIDVSLPMHRIDQGFSKEKVGNNHFNESFYFRVDGDSGITSRWSFFDVNVFAVD